MGCGTSVPVESRQAGKERRRASALKKLESQASRPAVDDHLPPVAATVVLVDYDDAPPEPQHTFNPLAQPAQSSLRPSDSLTAALSFGGLPGASASSANGGTRKISFLMGASAVSIVRSPLRSPIPSAEQSGALASTTRVENKEPQSERQALRRSSDVPEGGGDLKLQSYTTVSMSTDTVSGGATASASEGEGHRQRVRLGSSSLSQGEQLDIPAVLMDAGPPSSSSPPLAVIRDDSADHAMSSWDAHGDGEDIDVSSERHVTPSRTTARGSHSDGGVAIQSTNDVESRRQGASSSVLSDAPSPSLASLRHGRLGSATEQAHALTKNPTGPPIPKPKAVSRRF